MTDTLELVDTSPKIPKVDISDVLMSPEPLFEGSYPEVSEQLETYAHNKLRGSFLTAMIRTGKLNRTAGKRPKRADGTKYTSVPKPLRKAAARSKKKIARASRQKNRTR